MKIRESGMPGEGMWDGFFEPEEILKTLGLDSSITDAADFGCGYGTFTIPAAYVVKGVVYALDMKSKGISGKYELRRGTYQLQGGH